MEKNVEDSILLPLFTYQPTAITSAILTKMTLISCEFRKAKQPVPGKVREELVSSNEN